MSILNYISDNLKKNKQDKAWQQKIQQDATNFHMVTRRYPIRMILPMPQVSGTVSGGGSVYNGSGSFSVSGGTYTKYGLMIVYEIENGGWSSQVIDTNDMVELMHFTDEESYVIVKYQCSNSDNTIMETFYDGIFVNRNWQQTGR